MDAFAGVDLSEPIYGLITACLLAIILTIVTIRLFPRQRRSDDPLGGLFSSAQFDEQLNNLAVRSAMSDRATAVLSGRIDQLDKSRDVWGPDTRDEALEQIAQVMRAGVRKGDTWQDDEPVRDDGSFVLTAPGANESEASNIAARLMERLSSLPPVHEGAGTSPTASFGIASQRSGETTAQTQARAETARNVAQDRGDEQIIMASEWEEVVMLPAPAPTGSDETADGSKAA